MRRNQILKRAAKAVGLLFAGIFFMVSVLPAQVSASSEKTYEVTFRPGAHGKFVTEGISSKAEVNKNGSITYHIPAGSTFPDLPEIEAENGYRVKSDGWKPVLPAAGSKVEGRTTLVAQYARLVNAVEYTVEYVDTKGAVLATPVIRTTDLGTREYVRAKTIEGYVTDEADKTVTIDKKGMIIRFTYRDINSDAEEGSARVVIAQADENDAAQDQNQSNAGAAAVQNGQGAGNAQAGDGNLVDLPDGQVPLGGDNPDDELVDLPDEKTPLGGAPFNKKSSTVLLIAGGAAGILVLLLIAGAVILKKKKAH